MKSLDLKPKLGCEPDYFTIDSDIELMTTSPGGKSLHEVLATFGTTEFLMKQSILPVVAWSEGDDCIRTIGTASVISCSGYVMTAAHVLMDPFERSYGATLRGDQLEYAEAFNFGVFIPMTPASGRRGVTFFPFEKLWIWGEWQQSPLFHEPPRFEFLTDIAICKIPEMPHSGAHQPLNLSLNPFVQHETAYTVGYAEMKSIPIDYKNGGMSIKEFPADLYVSVGEVKDVFPHNHTQRNVPTPGPCFDFSAKIPGKMSGAPVFGGAGAVIRGVVSRSFGDGQRHAFGATLGATMTLPLDEPHIIGRTLRSLMKEGNEGIAEVHGLGL